MTTLPLTTHHRLLWRLVVLVRVDAGAFFLVDRLFKAISLDARLEADVTWRRRPAIDAIDRVRTRRQLGQIIEDDFLALDAMLAVAGALGGPELHLFRDRARDLDVGLGLGAGVGEANPKTAIGAH